MSRTIRWTALLMVFGLCLGSAARLDAQKLQVGTWTGTATAADGDSHDVTFEVTMAGDTLHISMVLSQRPPLVLSDLHFDQGKLEFSFQVDQKVTCSLSIGADGSYAGTCTDEDGNGGQLTLIPPKKTG